MEIGFGAGEHLAAQAAANPGFRFIGCEPFINGVGTLLDEIDQQKLTNIRIYDDDARPLLKALPDACLGRVFVLFSDPWPKKRHNRRRFIVPENLYQLSRLMKDGAELRFASDHMGYVRWALSYITAHGDFQWTAKSPSDWRTRSADAVQTRYEAKALGKGLPCVYLTFQRRSRR